MTHLRPVRWLVPLTVALFFITGLLGMQRAGAYIVWQQQDPLPQLVYLGQGPDTFTVEPSLHFVVKSPNGNLYLEVFETVFTAAAGERVWSSDRNLEGEGIPVFDDEVSLGNVPAGCQVDYVQIDDQIDERRNRFLLDGREIVLVEQGQVVYGSFVVPAAGELSFFAADSVALDYRLCTEQPEPTATPTQTITDTPTAPPTNTPGTPSPTLPPPTLTPTPGPGTPTAVPPTETPPPPTPTATENAPELTATPQATPTQKPRELACLRINFEVSGDAAQRGLYVVQEVGGMVLAEWYAEEGWQDSGWIQNIDIPYEAVYVDVLYYSGPDATPIRMKILNPAPGTNHGWVGRGLCHALEVGWP